MASAFAVVSVVTVSVPREGVSAAPVVSTKLSAVPSAWALTTATPMLPRDIVTVGVLISAVALDLVSVFTVVLVVTVPPQPFI